MSYSVCGFKNHSPEQYTEQAFYKQKYFNSIQKTSHWSIPEVFWSQKKIIPKLRFLLEMGNTHIFIYYLHTSMLTMSCDSPNTNHSGNGPNEALTRSGSTASPPGSHSSGREELETRQGLHNTPAVVLPVHCCMLYLHTSKATAIRKMHWLRFNFTLFLISAEAFSISFRPATNRSRLTFLLVMLRLDIFLTFSHLPLWLQWRCSLLSDTVFPFTKDCLKLFIHPLRMHNTCSQSQAPFSPRILLIPKSLAFWLM